MNMYLYERLFFIALILPVLYGIEEDFQGGYGFRGVDSFTRDRQQKTTGSSLGGGLGAMFAAETRREQGITDEPGQDARLSPSSQLGKFASFQGLKNELSADGATSNPDENRDLSPSGSDESSREAGVIVDLDGKTHFGEETNFDELFEIDYDHADLDGKCKETIRIKGRQGSAAEGVDYTAHPGCEPPPDKRTLYFEKDEVLVGGPDQNFLLYGLKDAPDSLLLREDGKFKVKKFTGGKEQTAELDGATGDKILQTFKSLQDELSLPSDLRDKDILERVHRGITDVLKEDREVEEEENVSEPGQLDKSDSSEEDSSFKHGDREKSEQSTVGKNEGENPLERGHRVLSELLKEERKEENISEHGQREMSEQTKEDKKDEEQKEESCLTTFLNYITSLCPTCKDMC